MGEISHLLFFSASCPPGGFLGPSCAACCCLSAAFFVSLPSRCACFSGKSALEAPPRAAPSPSACRCDTGCRLYSCVTRPSPVLGRLLAGSVLGSGPVGAASCRVVD